LKKPNILYLHSHDTGRLIQPYGYAVPTPNLQQLANEGVLFRQAFAAVPTCSPSRACLLTGTSAHRNGMLGLAHRGFALDNYSDHLIHTLHDQGYECTLTGIQHIAKDPLQIGYDRLIEPVNDYIQGVRGTECTVENVAPNAETFLKNAPREPFFFSVGFYETHTVYHPPGKKEHGQHSLPPFPIPDTPETRAEMAAFSASARVLDNGIGRVLAALHESGLEENTVVICTTDHGPAFPGMKCTLTDRGSGVFLLLRGPGGFSGGQISDALVSHLDIFPTICELLDIEPPERLEGRSLLPLLEGQKEIHDELFIEINFHAAYEPQRAIRTRRWKYIRRFGDRRRPVLCNVDDGPSKDLWVNSGWADQVLPDEELYDLILDPGECTNLAGIDAAREILVQMRRRLEAWMKDNKDPLLRGPLQAPPGADLNDPDSISHWEPFIDPDHTKNGA
jgi:arylsulfatase A-like enzyme